MRFCSRRAFAILALASPCVSTDLVEGATEVFRCIDGTELTVHYHSRAARVVAGNQSYELALKSSHLGRRFVSPEATLIVDGEFAAFVADNLHHLQGCRVLPKI